MRYEIDLTKYRWILVNSSAGKDSQTALRRVVHECRRQGVPLSRVVVSHQDLGRMEWPGVKKLAWDQARHYGLRFEVSKYRNKEGIEYSLLDYVLRRGKWPDNNNRWCTSDFKRGPGRRIITRLSREAPGRMLLVFGFRAEESPARRKKAPFVTALPKVTTKSRVVDQWLPIHDWTLKQVWDDIRDSGVPYHYAYDLGMPRLSCVFCIFAPFDALVLAGKHNPELLQEYVDVEARVGHTFKNGESIVSVQEAVKNNKTIGDLHGAWNM